MNTIPRAFDGEPFYKAAPSAPLRCKRCHRYWPDKCVCSQPHRSVARWPEHPDICLGSAANESTDEHPNREAAETVCRLLEANGFGGLGKVFPVSTHVEHIP